MLNREAGMIVLLTLSCGLTNDSLELGRIHAESPFDCLSNVLWIMAKIVVLDIDGEANHIFWKIRFWPTSVGTCTLG